MANNRLKMSLLPALHALIESGSVTGAAAAMHVTQSTMSRTLSQLRESLNDPILIRDGNRIYLSKKALEMQPLVARLLADAEELFDINQFSPATCKQHFRLVAGAGLQQCFLMSKLAELNQLAPGMTFSVVVTSDHVLSDMERGELDLGFVQITADDTDALRVSPIVDSDFYIAVRNGHPLEQSPVVELTQLDDFPYVEIYSPLAVNGFVDSVKRQSRSLKKPWLRVPGVQMALEVVQGCDAFAIVSILDYPALKDHHACRHLSFPIGFIQPRLNLVWPDYWEYNHAHQWLRKFFENGLRSYYRGIGMAGRLVGV
ncbi:MAG: LysR family transcriptional regulator [Endozoicomonas sp.]